MSDNFFDELASELQTNGSTNPPLPTPPTPPVPPLPMAQKPFTPQLPKQKQLKPTTPMMSPRPNGAPKPTQNPPQKTLPVERSFLKNRPMKRLELPVVKDLLSSADMIAQVQSDVPAQLSSAVVKGLNVPVIFPKSLEPQILPK